MIKKFICKVIWNLSETLNIDLGNFAPICLGWILGKEGKQVNIDKEENQ